MGVDFTRSILEEGGGEGREVRQVFDKRGDPLRVRETPGISKLMMWFVL